MNRLHAALVRSRELRSRHATERAVAHAIALAPTQESAHELSILAGHH